MLLPRVQLCFTPPTHLDHTRLSGTSARSVLKVSTLANPIEQGPSPLGFEGPQRWIIFLLNFLLGKPHLTGQLGVLVKSFPSMGGMFLQGMSVSVSLVVVMGGPGSLGVR